MVAREIYEEILCILKLRNASTADYVCTRLMRYMANGGKERNENRGEKKC